MFSFESVEDMKYYITEHVARDGLEVLFSGNKDRI